MVVYRFEADLAVSVVNVKSSSQPEVVCLEGHQGFDWRSRAAHRRLLARQTEPREVTGARLGQRRQKGSSRLETLPRTISRRILDRAIGMA